MADRTRRGMLITNNGTDTVRVTMSNREFSLAPGAQTFIAPEEVRDPSLREALQKRSIAIVRPATPQEDLELKERLEE